MRDKLEAVLDNGNGLPGRNPGNGKGKIDNGAAESELETHEMYGRQLTFHLVEPPRVMSLTDNFDSPVAGWCRIFRNIANFAQTQGAHEGRFGKAVRRDGERLPQLTEPEDNNDNRTAECL